MVFVFPQCWVNFVELFYYVLNFIIHTSLLLRYARTLVTRHLPANYHQESRRSERPEFFSDVSDRSRESHLHALFRTAYYFSYLPVRHFFPNSQNNDLAL